MRRDDFSPAPADSSKTCAICKVSKLLVDFHKQPSGPLGRHSYCKPCANQRARESRVRNTTPEQKRKWQFKTRYGLTPEQVAEMHAGQNHCCAICEKALAGARPCIDHNHATGAVREILCHPCNVKLHAVEDSAFLRRAQAYLAKHAQPLPQTEAV